LDGGEVGMEKRRTIEPEPRASGSGRGGKTPRTAVGTSDRPSRRPSMNEIVTAIKSMSVAELISLNSILTNELRGKRRGGRRG